VEEIFFRLEDQVFDISHNMALLMEALVNNFRPLGDIGGSNSEVGSDEKLGDSEDPKKESRKEHEKEKPSSNAITPSQSLFKMEAKVNIKIYRGDINVVNLNHQLQ
jgi:hypothetical protein